MPAFGTGWLGRGARLAWASARRPRRTTRIPLCGKNPATVMTTRTSRLWGGLGGPLPTFHWKRRGTHAEADRCFGVRRFVIKRSAVEWAKHQMHVGLYGKN